MAFPFLPLPEEEGNEPQSAEILEFPALWLAQAEVRRCKMVVDYTQHTIDTLGAGRMSPSLAVTMAEQLLPDRAKDLEKAEALLAALTAGTALTHNGVTYASTAGRA